MSDTSKEFLLHQGILISPNVSFVGGVRVLLIRVKARKATIICLDGVSHTLALFVCASYVLWVASPHFTRQLSSRCFAELAANLGAWTSAYVGAWRALGFRLDVGLLRNAEQAPVLGTAAIVLCPALLFKNNTPQKWCDSEGLLRRHSVGLRSFGNDILGRAECLLFRRLTAPRGSCDSVYREAYDSG